MSENTPHDDRITPSTDAEGQAPETAAGIETADAGYTEVDYTVGADADANTSADVTPVTPPAPVTPIPVTDAETTPVAAQETTPVVPDSSAPTLVTPPETVVAAPTATYPVPAPTADDTVTLDTYAPVGSTATLAEEPTVATPVANPFATQTAAPTTQFPSYAAPAAAATPIYVQAPTPPHAKGNRTGGILIALIATVAYTVLYAIAVFVIAGLTSATVEAATETFASFVVRPVFYIPVIFFFLAFAALIAIVNRGGWWAYVLFGFLVAVVVYFSYIGGALLTVSAWNLTPTEAAQFINTQWLNPGAIAAAIIAREVPVWFGAWIANRGRRVTERNLEARREYDRLLAEGPQLTRPA